MRLLTYNIHKGIGGRDRRYDLNRVIDVIEGENPDLICLQEVDHNCRRSRFHDQCELAGQALQRRRPAAADHRAAEDRRLRQPDSLALADSFLPPDFAADGRPSSRAVRRLAVVETPEGPLHLVHWHLGLAEKERHWQVDHLLTHHLFRQAGELPVLVAGDCNDWRNTLCGGPVCRGTALRR